jgi:dephospho-CoA kinase
MTYILGVTGGIGSGKTAATDQFATHGIEVVDADVIAHNVVQKGSDALNAITSHFGPKIILESGELNRKALREKVFDEPEEREWLENLLHPIIRNRIRQALQLAESPYVILSAPLLLENGLEKLCEKILVIDCSEENQIARTVSRDGNNEDTIKKIMQQQLSRKERLRLADDVIDNNGSLEELHKAVDHFHNQLMKTLVN